MKTLVVFLLLLLLLATPSSFSFAQVAIAPSTVFIDDRSNIGTIYISNRTDDTQEVSISFVFGYPTSDEFGNMVMTYDDPESYELYALDEWIRAFPRSFVLAPRQQQAVRFQVRPQPEKDDGVYWTRVKILANPQASEIDVTASEEEIATRVTFRFEQIIAAFYKKGNTTTGVLIHNIDVLYEDERLILMPHLERTGNAPFIGSMFAKIYDAEGTLVAERQRTTTAYFKETRRLDIDVAGLEPGNYRVELTFETRRGDISPTDLVQAPPITEVVEVRIP